MRNFPTNKMNCGNLTCHNIVDLQLWEFECFDMNSYQLSKTNKIKMCGTNINDNELPNSLKHQQIYQGTTNQIKEQNQFQNKTTNIPRI